MMQYIRKQKVTIPYSTMRSDSTGYDTLRMFTKKVTRARQYIIIQEVLKQKFMICFGKIRSEMVSEK